MEQANQSLSATDLFKNSVLEGFSLSRQNLTVPNVLLSLACAFLLGLLIFYVYKKTYRGVLYSHSFNISLIMLTMVTAMIIMCISSSIGLSLGMVGALSIVRFRTAVKEPLDTCYMFWAITMGILLGAKQYAIALVVAVGIGVILIFLSYVHFRHPNAYLLVIHYDEGAEPDIEAELRRGTHFRRMRSKTVTRGGAEMTVEIRLGNRSDIVGHMLDIKGVHDATLVACQNETGA